MFDFGFAVMDRMDDKIAVRYNECAADYARLGVLASQDGIYDEETAKTLGLVSFENDKKKNFFCDFSICISIIWEVLACLIRIFQFI